MAGVNRVILVGHLGAKPEVRTSPNGNSHCQMSLATSESWKDKNGNRQERTEWHRLVAWGKTAELCAQYLDKGRQIYVDGRLQTQKYEKDGVTRWSTQIVVNDVQFLGSKDGQRRDDAAVPPEPSATWQSDEDMPF